MKCDENGRIFGGKGQHEQTYAGRKMKGSAQASGSGGSGKSGSMLKYLLLVPISFLAIAFLANSLASSSGGSGTGQIPVSGKLAFSQAIGKQAPDFSLGSIDGRTARLSDYRGKNVVLFFNEGGMCYPACWNQMEAFASDERFNSNDVVAFSIVVEDKGKWDEIVKKVAGLSNAKILFDSNRAVSSAYDVLNLPSSMHRGSYPGHTYFVIDREGIIRYTLDDPNMGVWNDKLASELEKLK